ncbi:competence/damage-inducible protein A [Aquibacillus sediminis]|uniref:competence/damage-inducible protein A n=1 Tax=Aquibacillus sediminis TaxID=2574734 RepID=UPI001107C100|nr:competence/damage-inducible protein A [Aquibacillus sediminis]
MSKYKAEIIAVGTELLLGQIANTNAQWLSKRLADYGMNTYYHVVVGDNLERVTATLEQAGKRSDIVFITGGLGPTDDDLTREAFQRLSQQQLVEHQGSLDKITEYFTKNNRHMTPNNRKQSLVFQDAHVLANDVGMAPGMIVEYNQVLWVFMPGVPREMKAITDHQVLPYLDKKLQLNAVIQSRMLRFIGIGESQLEHHLKPLIDAQHNPTIAPLASEGEVAIRLTAKANTKTEALQLLDQAESKVQNHVGDYFYGYDEEVIQEKVVQMLEHNSMTIAAAESLTGGKFTDTLVSVSGASNVCKGGIVSYTTDVKQNILNIPKEIIIQDGTISEACATLMAQNVQKTLNTDIGISFTGVAGPSEVEQQPVGTVFIGLYHQSGKLIVKKFNFQGDREAIRNRAVKKGLELIYQFCQMDNKWV